MGEKNLDVRCSRTQEHLCDYHRTLQYALSERHSSAVKLRECLFRGAGLV